MYKQAVLDEIRRKQGRTIVQISKAADVMPAAAVKAKTDLIAEGVVYEHPVSKGLYIVIPSAKAPAKKEESTTPPVDTVNQKLREEFARVNKRAEEEKSVSAPVVEEKPVSAPVVEEKPVSEPVAEKVQAEESEPPVETQEENPEIVYHGTTKTFPELTEESIVSYIANMGPVSASDLGFYYNRTGQSFGSILRVLREKGLIVGCGKNANNRPLFDIPNRGAIKDATDQASASAPVERVSPEDALSEFNAVCERVIDLLSESDKSTSYLQDTLGCTYSDMRQVLDYLSKRQRIRKSGINQELWGLFEKGRNARRVTRQEILALLSDGAVHDSYAIAKHFGRNPSSFGALLGTMVKEGSVMRVSGSPASYRIVSSDAVSDAMKEIDQFAISVNTKYKDDEQPKPHWLPIIAKLQDVFGGATGALLGEVHSYLQRRLEK